MKKLIWFVALIIIIFPINTEAQCAMCKAVAESSQQGGSSIADGLNSGIMYLMAFPYILMFGVGFAIYKYKKGRS